MDNNENNFLDEIFNGSSDDELFNEKEEALLFEPRKLAKFKAELEKRGKEIDDVTEFDVLLDDLSGSHAERMNNILGNMSETNFVNTYAKLLGYVKPKYKAKDVERVIPSTLTQINVTIHRTSKDD